LPEAAQFSVQVVGILEEYLIQEFATGGADQAFDEGIG